jgi:hypothetical protein
MMPLSTSSASAGISNLPVSVEYLTSSRGVPGLTGKLASAAASVGFCFLEPPKKNDMVCNLFQVSPSGQSLLCDFEKVVAGVAELSTCAQYILLQLCLH